MNLIYTLALITFFLFVLGILLRSALMLGLGIGIVVLILLYWVVKLAVKDALEEYDQKKGPKRG